MPSLQYLTIIFMFVAMDAWGQEGDETPEDTNFGAYCKNGVPVGEEVSRTLVVINSRRAMFANRLWYNISSDEQITFIPPAINVKKMTYDCALEQEASEFLAKITCPQDLMYQGEQRPDRGFFIQDYSALSFLNSFLIMSTVMGECFVTTNKSVKYNVNAESPAYEDLLLAINLLVADASKIGCASKRCEDPYDYTYNFCMTNQKNLQYGEDIFEIGEQTCDPLIPDVEPSVTSQAEFPGSDSEPSTWCEWKEMNDSLREQMRDTHNSRRTTLALGTITDNTGTALPAATNMNYLAVTEWWKPVRKVAGPGTSVIFRSAHNSSTIKSFTLMGWASTTEIGCSVAMCGNDWVEACRYYPPGNKVDEQMYRKGKACSECSSFGVGTCDPQSGLCVSKE